MVFTATVLYPAEADLKFDLSYYMNNHIPLVVETWTPHGLKDWKVIEFIPGPDGSKPYRIGAVLTWDSADSVKAALESDAGKIVLEDLPHFSNKTPLFLLGDVLGTS
jgi:uncharacterized protein (TIGR02118 family)